MATEFSMINTINAALLATGKKKIADSDGSVEWLVLSENWPFIVEAELEESNFHFTKEEAEITVRNDGKFGFDDSYLVPDAALHVRNVRLIQGDNRYDCDWVQDATSVHVNWTDGIWIEYIVVSDPAVWSANFALGIQMRLQALILRSLKEEAREADKMDARADEKLQRARTLSSSARSKSAPFKRSGSIISARKRHG